MGLPKTVRLEDHLDAKIQKYLQENDLRFSNLVHLALEKFISEPQTIELQPVHKDEFLEKAKKAFKKNKNAMDKLK